MTTMSDIDAALANLRAAFAQCEAAGLQVRATNKAGVLWVGVRDCRADWRGGRAAFTHDSEAALRREIAAEPETA